MSDTCKILNLILIMLIICRFTNAIELRRLCSDLIWRYIITFGCVNVSICYHNRIPNEEIQKH